jgi:signal transduction histidine kinase
MRMAGEPSKPSFLWQAVLILLPVAVLAVIGWASLRQDKLLAQHDAQQRAQVFADQLAPSLWTQLIVSPDNDSSNQVVFQVDESGALIFPAPYDPAPAPAPFPLEQLSPEQARLWAISQNSSTGAVADATAACQRLINSKPPERFAAAAQFQLGLLQLQQRKFLEAAKSFDLVASQYPGAVGESGLPLGPLAQFKILEIQPFPHETEVRVNRELAVRTSEEPVPDLSIALKHFVSLDSFCSNIVYHPTLLTPFLLAQARESVRPLLPTLGINGGRNISNLAARTNQWEITEKWQRVWAEHERAREIFAAAGDHLRANSPFLPIGTNKIASAPIPSIFWFTLPRRSGFLRTASDSGQVVTLDENWIATRTDTGTNSFRFICRPESDFGLRITKNTASVPAYFSVGVEMAGKRIAAGAPAITYWHSEYVPGGKGGGQYWEKKYSGKISTNLLASATHLGNADEPLTVSIFLTNPDELFESQQSRAMWFGLLVIASTVAALIGLFTAWRAFHRQLRLAEMKSNFVSSVSHELRAPIASVRLMAESLERGKVHEPLKQNEYFRFIVQECRRLSSLIENVLDFSRIEQGRKQYEFEPTDLLALTRETVKLMEPYAEEKGVRLELNSKLETRNSELDVDGRAIQQALVNLIDNAIKHSAKGQAVRIGIEETAGTDHPASSANTSLTPRPSSLSLFVEDSGAGIPPAEHEKIFERFYRLGSELRRETQGVGIGLSIVRHIVEAHGGRVTVRSNVGQGSRFTIELPLTPKPQMNTDER